MSETPAPLVVVLAGDRGPGDPIATAAGVQGKVLAPIAGTPMLSHVIGAIDAAGLGESLVVVCPDRPGYADAIGSSVQWQRVEPAAGPASSLIGVLRGVSDHTPVLVVTGDHPLIRSHWLREFVERASATASDAVVALVDWHHVQARFPTGRRTRYRFSDISICGTNLFYFRGRRGRDVVAAWQSFERDRKRPWRIVGRLGWLNLARYLARRLTLAQAFAALSARLGVEVHPLIVDWPEAAVDVDSMRDMELVEQVFAERAVEPA